MSTAEATRLPQLMSRDRVALDALLDATIVGHIAFVGPDGGPIVLPTAAVRWGDRLVVHGSTGSRWLRLLVGTRAVISVATVDGIIVARSAFESSLAYRSAVLFGSFQQLAGKEKLAALDSVTDRLISGRVAEVRDPTPKELAATLVLAMPIAEWSLRISDGWAEDVEDDVAGPAWAGRVVFGSRQVTTDPAPDLRPQISLPPSIAGIRATH